MRLDPPLRAALLAEFVGTFALVFVGCGAIVAAAQLPDAFSPLSIPIVFGSVIMVMVYATGHVSGAHFNPAVTLAFTAVGAFPRHRLVPYWLTQLLAAITAAGLLRSLFGNVATLGSTQPIAGVGVAFVVEVVLTFLLMFVIMAVATDHRSERGAAGLAIGSMVLLAAVMGGPLSGASLNPARSLGPALVSGTLSNQWLYVLAPSIGAVLGALSYRLLQSSK
jgi:MIP family channel proteins